MKQIFVVPVQIDREFCEYCKTNNINLIVKKLKCRPYSAKLTKEEDAIIKHWKKKYQESGFTSSFICNIYEFNDFGSTDVTENYYYLMTKILFAVAKKLINQTVVTFDTLENGMISSKQERI